MHAHASVLPSVPASYIWLPLDLRRSHERASPSLGLYGSLSALTGGPNSANTGNTAASSPSGIPSSATSPGLAFGYASSYQARPVLAAWAGLQQWSLGTDVQALPVHLALCDQHNCVLLLCMLYCTVSLCACKCC